MPEAQEPPVTTPGVPTEETQQEPGPDKIIVYYRPDPQTEERVISILEERDNPWDPSFWYNDQKTNELMKTKDSRYTRPDALIRDPNSQFQQDTEFENSNIINPYQPISVLEKVLEKTENELEEHSQWCKEFVILKLQQICFECGPKILHAYLIFNPKYIRGIFRECYYKVNDWLLYDPEAFDSPDAINFFVEFKLGYINDLTSQMTPYRWFGNDQIPTVLKKLINKEIIPTNDSAGGTAPIHAPEKTDTQPSDVPPAQVPETQTTQFETAQEDTTDASKQHLHKLFNKTLFRQQLCHRHYNHK